MLRATATNRRAGHRQRIDPFPRLRPSSPLSHPARLSARSGWSEPDLLSLQRLAGNGAVGSLLQGSARIQRRTEPDPTGAGPGAGGTLATRPRLELTNARFRGDRVLERILSGDLAALSERHNGRGGAVSKVQAALVDLGFELPMHQVDGRYGAETEEALRQFRSDRGLPAGSQLDSPALAALDRAAPAPGQREEHTVDYGRLLADDRLDISVAMGHAGVTILRQTGPDRNDRRSYEETEHTWEDLAAGRFRQWMRDRGFELAILGWGPNEYWEGRTTVTVRDADGNEQQRQIRIWLNLITPGRGASEEFQQALTDSEIAIYAGHARYGSGPDFDEKASAAENFRIGIDAARRAAGRRTSVDEARRHGVAVDEENDLVQMVNSGDFDRDRYRVWFMSACTSLAYLDEFRSHVGGGENLDVVASRAPVMFRPTESDSDVRDVQRFLEGILAAESIESILAALNQQQVELTNGNAPRGGVFTTSGFGDNPTR